ncbi:hypothetical protein [Aliiglaciecola sp. LCG003]|uniref:hypothetical protein n=1 Tax=Aliiglaciecola sp. LCG003 TaxID=3053655 RepID=UPI002573F2BA|nr:hypothetical protein [Aliiglaciecola sp. LCG003]WJG08853.1 hypothetical protein QR722_16155 [Aliiglaciecola sp. LCG003]
MKYIYMLLILTLVGCNADDELTALTATASEDKVWVFAQFNVQEETDGTESYYYYAMISAQTYKLISNNKLKQGFILLENVKYWGANDLIYDYRDEENSGELVFRIEDIVKLDLVNQAPIVGKGVEQYDSEQSKEEEVSATQQAQDNESEQVTSRPKRTLKSGL